MSWLITADASKISPGDFFRMARGLPPMSEAEKAEREARAARVNLVMTIERIEFGKARREREAIQLAGQRDSETYDQFVDRAWQPMVDARRRVGERVAAYDRKAAA